MEIRKYLSSLLSKLSGSAQQFKQPYHYPIKSTAWPFIPWHAMCSLFTWWCEAVPRQKHKKFKFFIICLQAKKKETDKLYNLKKIYAAFAVFQEHGSCFDILSSLCVRYHMELGDSVFWSCFEKMAPSSRKVLKKQD